MATSSSRSRAGFFTQQKYLQGRTLREIEQLLGYNQGRLKNGALIGVLTKLPTIDQFSLAGYSQVASQHIQKQYPNINNPGNKYEKDAYLIKKRNAMAGWGLNGAERLVKIFPNVQHLVNMDPDKQYPPGEGIPQWKLDTLLTWTIIADLSHYPDERFIPNQGYVPVRYI